MEGEAGGVLDAAGVDAFGGEDVLVLGEEVFADDADDAGWGEEGGGEGEVGGGAAEDLAGFAVGVSRVSKATEPTTRMDIAEGGVSGSGWFGVSFHYAGWTRLC